MNTKDRPMGIIIYPYGGKQMHFEIICLLMIYGVLMLGAVIAARFPTPLTAWVTAVAAVLAVSAAVVLSWGCRLCVDTENVKICLLGKVLRTIPVTAFEMLYAVGTPKAVFLCFHTETVERLASQRERTLEKGIFSKGELPFRKRKSGWQEAFAREQIVSDSGRGHALWRKKPQVWLGFDPALLLYLRQQFPQLPYIDLRTEETDWLADYPPMRIPNVTAYMVDAKPEGVRITKGNREVCLLPSQELQTLMRVDRYAMWSKYERPHRTYLIASRLSVAQLAALGRIKIKQKWKVPLIDSLNIPKDKKEKLLAAACCSEMIFWWSPRENRVCPLNDKPENERILRQLYLNARWVDISKEWAI